MKFRKAVAAFMITFTLFTSSPAKADIFGADVVVLTQILAQAIMQLIQLKNLVTSSNDTIDFLREINSGIREGLAVIQILNPKFSPGVYGNLSTSDQVLTIINELYGHIPQTSEYRLQQAQDQSVAESIAMNGTLFNYADQVDLETKQIIEHARDVSPQGAGKLTAQSLAVLIGVSTQVLRTNSMMLKMMSENMALSNRKEKLQSEQFKNQYDGLSGAFSKLPADPKLIPLNKKP